jgi:hypothetical protein
MTNPDDPQWNPQPPPGGYNPPGGYPPPGLQYGPSPAPQFQIQGAPGRRRRYRGLLGCVPAALVLLVIIVAAVVVSGGRSGVQNGSGSPQVGGTAQAVGGSAPAGAGAANSLTGPVGTVYRISDGSGHVMTVRLLRLIDPARGSDSFNSPDRGKRLVGAVFALKGISGALQDDANNDAALVGANGQTYTADFDTIARYTNFNDGEFTLRPGVKSVGAVTFQVPVGVKVASVQWTSSSGFGSTATWTRRGRPTS